MLHNVRNNMSNMPQIKNGVLINVTPDEDKTYNSDSLKSFTWRKKEDYRYGQLIVMFQGSATKYLYDVPRKPFEEMAKRAFLPEYTETEYHKSAWDWYDSELVNYVDSDRTYPDKNNVLYFDIYDPSN